MCQSKKKKAYDVEKKDNGLHYLIYEHARTNTDRSAWTARDASRNFSIEKSPDAKSPYFFLTKRHTRCTRRINA